MNFAIQSTDRLNVYCQLIPPKNFKNNDFEYIDESIGDINNFTGSERILFKGQEIYRLIYHGSSM